jgi:transposase
MARKPTRFVEALTDQEREMLAHLRDHGETPRIRRRAHAILLSGSGKSVNELADIFDTNRITVCSWISRWEADGPLGLGDEQRPGGPPILTEEERKQVVDLIREFPNSPKTVLDKITEKFGKSISARTLRRVARSAKLRWKRMRRSLKSKRNEEDFREAQEELKGIIEESNAGEYDLYYFDEAAFSLVPTVPYGWQPEGERLEIPSQKSGQVSVLGFLSYGGDLVPYVTDGIVDADIVVACMDDFSTKIGERPSLVVIDNASPHTSAKFKSRIETWESRGLFHYFLPPYCPELNLIEILWRMIKHHWLPLKAYTNFTSLLDNLNHVLANVGTEYRLCFSQSASTNTG